MTDGANGPPEDLMATRRRKASKGRPAKRRPAKKKAASRARKKTRAATPRGSDAVRALARRIVALTTANDDEATFALYAADVESTEQGQPPMRGIDSIRQKFAGWRNMVSAAHFEPRRVVVDGNTIVIEWVGEVTLAASGKQARLHEVAVHEIQDGKIVREAYFYDPATLS
jgi:ketosteroid isomerase-like protein